MANLIVNSPLLSAISSEILAGMGFAEHDDKSGDPRGIDWSLETKGFRITIDPWAEVQLVRLDDSAVPATEPITIHCESLDALQELINWIADDK